MSSLPRCSWCGEPVIEDSELFSNTATHKECALRMIIGGVNHLQGLCICCGGKLPPDPPGMSKRMAALAAVAYLRSHPKYTRWLNQP